AARFQCVLLFQRLIRRHLADQRPDALITVDLERIDFVQDHGIAENKKTLYLGLLSRITDRYGDLPVAAEAWFLQAEEYARNAKPTEISTEAPNSDTIGNAKAVAICDRVLAQKDTSEGWAHCYQLQQNLRRKEIHMITEEMNIPGQPFRVFVRYQNTSRMY